MFYVRSCQLLASLRIADLLDLSIVQKVVINTIQCTVTLSCVVLLIFLFIYVLAEADWLLAC